MKIYKVAIFWSVIILLFFGYGTFVKRNFKDEFSQNSDSVGLKELQVAQIPEEDTYLKLMQISEEEAYLCQTVLVVEASGEIEFVYGNTLQTVKIKQVVENNKNYDLQPEQIIKICGQGSINAQDRQISMGFCNFLQKGKEYLIFLRRPIQKVRSDVGEVYELNDFMIMFKMLCLEEIENRCVEDDIYADYKEVAGNEFFVQTEKVQDMAVQMKEKIIQKVLYHSEK